MDFAQFPVVVALVLRFELVTVGPLSVFSTSFEEVRAKIRGKISVSGTLSIGRQAHIMPVLASMIVHMVEIMVPYVWSTDLEDVSRVVMRRIEVTQTLVVILEKSNQTVGETYKLPSANTNISPNF